MHDLVTVERCTSRSLAEIVRLTISKMTLSTTKLSGVTDARHDALAETEGRVDHDLAPVAVGRVDRECDPGGLRQHHLLNGDGHGNGIVRVALSAR